MLNKWKTVLTATRVEKNINENNFMPKYVPKSPLK